MLDKENNTEIIKTEKLISMKPDTEIEIKDEEEENEVKNEVMKKEIKKKEKPHVNWIFVKFHITGY